MLIIVNYLQLVSFYVVSPRLRSSIFNHGQWLVPQYPSYGESVVMSCPLEGNPPASYQWYFEKSYDNGSHSQREPIQPGNYLNITLLNNNQTLFFSEIKEEHNGRYTCNAENSLGSNKECFHTKVHRK